MTKIANWRPTDQKKKGGGKKNVQLLPNMHKPEMCRTKSNWFRWDKLNFIFLYYVQHLALSLNFALRGMVTKYQVFQDVTYNLEGLNKIFHFTLNKKYFSAEQ